MWRAALFLCQLLNLKQVLTAQETGGTINSRECSLECIQQGLCEYCRIHRADVEKTLGIKTFNNFGSCIPWPCLYLLDDLKNSDLCQHYVRAPNNVRVEFESSQNPNEDTIVVSWRPSEYGIAFLRGFQVSLQALGGSQVACQLFLFQRNLSLPASYAQREYRSDPFPGLALSGQYAVTVMALPVPERWDEFYKATFFSTRTCAEKIGIDNCKRDWYPKNVVVRQESSSVVVTFNLAPPDLGIVSYFSLCYKKGLRGPPDILKIHPNLTKNQTHCSYAVPGLQEGSNYTCEIAADEVDSVRRTFQVQVMYLHNETPSPSTAPPPLSLMVPVVLVLIAIVVVFLAVLKKKRTTQRLKTLLRLPDFTEERKETVTSQEEVTSLTRGKLTPPQLLICYCSRDGPAHVRAVMQLGAFLQQHMATKVCLDLWDSLSMAEEGVMGWHYRRIKESDFVLVVCSHGLNHSESSNPDGHDDDEGEKGLGEEEGWESTANNSAAAVALIGEELGRAKAGGRDLSKYMAAIFEYSEEVDVPAALGLLTCYKLPRDLPLLFSRLHGVSLHRPGGYLKIEHLSQEGYTKLPAGAALQWAIREAGLELKDKHAEEGEDGLCS